MKILIIGCSGFLGTHLAQHLVQRGHEVEGWSRTRADLPASVLQREVDLLAKDGWPSARAGSASSGPWDAAVHLAASSVPGVVWDRARIDANVALVTNVAGHLARVQPGLRFLFLSSSHVYADARVAHVEDEPRVPQGPYGLSKHLCEEWLGAHTHALDVRIARSFSQLGARMPSGLLIPDLMRAIEEGAGPLRMAGQNSTRDFVDVRDGVAALESLLTLDAPSGSVFNVCTGVGHEVAELARGLMIRLGRKRELVFASDARPMLIGSPEKLKLATGWHPKHTLDDTLDHIVAHARA